MIGCKAINIRKSGTQGRDVKPVTTIPRDLQLQSKRSHNRLGDPRKGVKEKRKQMSLQTAVEIGQRVSSSSGDGEVVLPPGS